MLSKNGRCARVFSLNPHLFVVSFVNLMPSTAVASSGTPPAVMAGEGGYSIGEG